MQMNSDSIIVTLHDAGNKQVELEPGTRVCDLLSQVMPKNPSPFLAALVNNYVVSLSYPLEVDSRVRFLTLQDSDGWRVYQRSMSFLLAKAAKRLWSDVDIRVEHSLDTGLYCSYECNGCTTIDSDRLTLLQDCMEDIVNEKKPIVWRKIYFEDALRHFENRNQPDKCNLLRFRNPPKVTVHQCGDFIDLAHGPLVDNTEMVNRFRLVPYAPGFVIQFPDRNQPAGLVPFERQEQIFTVFQCHKKWGRSVGIQTVGDLNKMIVHGEFEQFVRIEESFQEKQISRIADQVHEREGRVRWILIAGPSSSGKTTFAKRLAVALKVNGLDSKMVSVDNYFVDRINTPLDEQGNYDFEHIDALDLELISEHLRLLDEGKEVVQPRFDFVAGTRRSDGIPVQLHPGQIGIIEGIHGLNPRLSHVLAPERKFKIYISALTQLNLDMNNRISTTDNRLIRRMVRDNLFRGHSALRTLEMWPSVREGEKRWIFPHQSEADVAFSSALGYEMAVLKPFAEPLLTEVKPYHDDYTVARRLQAFLKCLVGAPVTGVPRNSLLREFVGNSGFIYS